MIYMDYYFAFRPICTTFAGDFNALIDNMAKLKGAIVVNTDRCKGCVLCVSACPHGVIALANRVNMRGYPYVEPAQMDKCTGCTSCAVVCPDGCITVYRKKVEE